MFHKIDLSCINYWRETWARGVAVYGVKDGFNIYLLFLGDGIEHKHIQRNNHIERERENWARESLAMCDQGEWRVWDKSPFDSSGLGTTISASPPHSPSLHTRTTPNARTPRTGRNILNHRSRFAA